MPANKFFDNISAFKGDIEKILSNIEPFIVLGIMFAVIYIVHNMTEDEPFVDEKRIFMLLVSIILITNYQEISYNIASWCNELSNRTYRPSVEIVEIDNFFVTDASYSNGSVWRQGFAERSGMEKSTKRFYKIEKRGVGERVLRTVQRDRTHDLQDKYILFEEGFITYDQAVQRAQKGDPIDQMGKKIMEFIQFAWATILYLLGPVAILFSFYNSKIIKTYLAEFVAINLWPLAISMVDFLRHQVATGDLGDDFDGSGWKIGIKFMYFFCPLIISMIIPGTISNTVLQRVTGMIGITAGVASMAGRTAGRGLTKIVRK